MSVLLLLQFILYVTILIMRHYLLFSNQRSQAIRCNGGLQSFQDPHACEPKPVSQPHARIPRPYLVFQHVYLWSQWHCLTQHLQPFCNVNRRCHLRIHHPGSGTVQLIIDSRGYLAAYHTCSRKLLRGISHRSILLDREFWSDLRYNSVNVRQNTDSYHRDPRCTALTTSPRQPWGTHTSTATWTLRTSRCRRA